MNNIPTTPENQKRITDFMNDIAPLMCNLYARWKEEKKYESIHAYEDVIFREMPIGFNMLNMSERPFGFTFDIGTGVVYKIKLVNRMISWERM